MKRADELANEYHNTDSNVSREQIRAEWYKECSKVAEKIQAAREFERKRRDARNKRRGSSSEKPYFADVFKS